MILKDLMNHFNIEEDLPVHLLNHAFNEIFLDGKLSENNNNYKIIVTTRQNVTHQMHIKPHTNFPVTIMSILPNGKLNGMKFGLNEGEEIPITKL